MNGDYSELVRDVRPFPAQMRAELDVLREAIERLADAVQVLMLERDMARMEREHAEKAGDTPVKLTTTQRGTLAALKAAGGARTAAQLGARPQTLWILRRSGCVTQEPYTTDGTETRRTVSNGVLWSITDKGRQEAAG